LSAAVRRFTALLHSLSPRPRQRRHHRLLPHKQDAAAHALLDVQRASCPASISVTTTRSSAGGGRCRRRAERGGRAAVQVFPHHPSALGLLAYRACVGRIKVLGDNTRLHYSRRRGAAPRPSLWGLATRWVFWVWGWAHHTKEPECVGGEVARRGEGFMGGRPQVGGRWQVAGCKVGGAKVVIRPAPTRCTYGDQPAHTYRRQPQPQPQPPQMPHTLTSLLS
jgi:hypothetical protein